jgi:phosphate-selective porin OprO and OprP
MAARNDSAVGRRSLTLCAIITKRISKKDTVMATFPRAAGLFPRRKRRRLLHSAGTALIALASGFPALAQDTSSSTFSSSMLSTTWDEGSPMIGSAQPSSNEAALAARVAALEKLVAGGDVVAASTQEPLPAGAAKVVEDCKKLDIVTRPTATLKGRILIDLNVYDDDDETAEFFGVDRENEFGFDTVRLGAQGIIYERMSYYLEVEFEGEETDFKDVYIDWELAPFTFRGGHFKEPYSLEELTSDVYTTFMKRSFATQTFAPVRSYGVMAFDHLDACQTASWFVGAFRNDSDDSPPARATARDDRDDFSVTERFAWVPYYDEPSNGRYHVHLGGSHSHRQSVAPVQFLTQGYIGIQAPIGVGVVAEDEEWEQLGVEYSIVWGSLSFQAEYYHAFVHSGEQYNGAYAQVSYFLTGEHRVYRKDRKAYDRITPFEPAFWIDTCGAACCGRGAWELAAGYSYVDLEDGADIPGGPAGPVGDRQRAFVDGVSFGVNWYLASNSRVTFDYLHEMTDFLAAATPDSNANVFGVRWQIDW